MIPKLNTIVTEKLRPEHFGDPINQHHSSFQTNSLESLDQLRNTLPNVRWISVVVSWFATSLDGGHCEILPGVEYKNTYTSPDEWRVSHWSRATAHLVSQIDGRPQYGGTVNDASLIRYLVELRKQGFKIMLYPIIMVDVAGKPWRGRIKGDQDSIPEFFKKYNYFILHYANLVTNNQFIKTSDILINSSLVDAFIIGSEMIGLTTSKNQQITLFQP